MKFPIIKNISGEWNLVEHPNGPAIFAEFHEEQWILSALESENDDDVPRSIRTRAVQLYREFSWPKVKAFREAAAELDEIRSVLMHGADEDVWPPGLTLAQAIERLKFKAQVNV